ncbi:ATP-binding protein [Actinophytocola oryzae]|uniref:Histidine kinase n=1 Tax=Actinophytocola oryzae TaxID=502181 RepID=A0A4R7VQW7_9PSEU|nr:ATP-binding protein [Actinophytocola oryzae]TDV52032.1 histidine kinase [Actinophytocola oryzae]
MRSDRAFLRFFSSPGKEVLISRVLALVAVAAMSTAIATQLLDVGVAPAAHPRHWFVAVACTLLGLRVVAYTPRNAVGWLILAMGLFSALTVGTQALSVWFVPAWLGTWLWWPSYALLPVAALLFPDGRPTSRRWWSVLVVAALGVLLPVVGIGWGSWSSPATFWEDAVKGTARGGLPVVVTVAGVLSLFAGLVGSVWSLVVRWLRADRGRRRLLVWSSAGTALLTVALVLEMAGTVWGAWAVVAAAFPVATLVAILWYGLYDIELLVHRSLLFGLITLILAGVNTVVVLALTTTPPTPGHVIGTLAVVLMLAPLHRRLRGLLDRWLFGDRADPYRALSRLGEQLENLLQPDEVLKTIASSVGNGLKLPYVSVQVDSLFAASGTSRQWPQLTLPLRHDDGYVGNLVVEARAPEEGFGRSERRLLDDLARQAALATRSARLAKELQRIDREHVEDLRYVTGEVHDNLAPGVAAVRLQIDALRRTGICMDERLSAKLCQIGDDLSLVLREIRTVVHRVRPIGLHAGLLEIVRRRASTFQSKELTVTVTPVGMLDGLSASVEEEAYRIVSAALGNVAEHANASACEVRLVQDAERLEINVIDNGTGIPADVVPGVGLESMRHRCEKRGGRFEIERRHPGTRIVAVLPLGDPTASAVNHEDADGR